MKRGLSGLYILEKDENGKRVPTCIEDCSEEVQNAYFKGQCKEWLEKCCKILCRTLKDIGEQFDIVRE